MPTITYTSLSAASPTIIVGKFLKYTMPRTVMASRVTRADQWPGAQQYGHAVTIPTFLTRPPVAQLNTSLSGQGAEAEPPAVSYTAPTIGSVTLVIDQWWYIGFQRTVFADAIANSLINWDAAFRQAGMDSLAVKIDATLTDLLDGFSTVKGIDGAPVQVQDLLDAKDVLDATDVPEDDRTYVLSAGGMNSLLNLEVIVNQLYGSAGNISQGKLTKPLYGSPVFATTNLPAGTAGRKGGYFHREALALAMRRNPMAHNPGFDNPSTLSREQTFFAIWGVKELRDPFGVELDMKT